MSLCVIAIDSSFEVGGIGRSNTAKVAALKRNIQYNISQFDIKINFQHQKVIRFTKSKVQVAVR